MKKENLLQLMIILSFLCSFLFFLVKKLCKFGVFFGPVGGYELLALNTYNKKAMH